MTGAPRVEMLLPALYPAGMETMVAELCRGLAARGVEVGITCLESEGAMAPRLREEGLRVSVVPTPGFLPNLIPAEPLRRWLRELRPDVAHVHSGVWLKAAQAARAAGVPRVVFTSHGLLDRIPRHHVHLMRLAARLTDSVVGVSEPLTSYHAVTARTRPGQAVTILNGVDTGRFRPGAPSGAVRRGFDHDHGPVVGIVARFADVKDHATLLDAFAIVHRARPDAVLALIGDGPLRPVLAAQVAALGLGQAVQFTGAASDMPPVYRDLDIFVLCSVAEGTSISILEAMASGRAIVATAVGGTPMLLDHGRAGMLVPPGNPAALADALLELLADPGQRTALGRAARERAEAVFSQRTMVDRYLELYGMAGAGAPEGRLQACAE